MYTSYFSVKKSWHCLVVLSLLFFSLHGQAQPDDKPYQTKQLQDARISDIELSTSGGSLTIVHQPGEAMRIEVFVRGNNWNKPLSAAETEALLAKYSIVTEMKGTKLIGKATRISEKNNNDYKNSLSISFKVYAPAQVNTITATSGGSIVLHNIGGTHQMATSGGSLQLRQVKGTVKGATSGGSVQLVQADCTGELATSGGSMEATDSRGSLKMSTSGGSIKLQNLDGVFQVSTSGGSIKGSRVKGELKAYTSGGSVDLDEMACSLDAGTSGGNMRIGMIQTGQYLKLSNTSGDIDLTLPGNKPYDLDISATQINYPTLQGFSGEMNSQRSLRGQLLGGGTPVQVKALSGRVNLRFSGKQAL